jgi:hypothetical protein
MSFVLEQIPAWMAEEGIQALCERPMTKVGPRKQLACRTGVHSLDGISGAKTDCTASNLRLSRQLYDLLASLIEAAKLQFP